MNDETVETETPVSEPEQKLSPLADKANKVLEESKNKFDVVIVIGLDNKGKIDINANLPQYPTMQYMISRAAFELNVHEMNYMQQKEGKKDE